MNILVISDIHGNSTWKNIVKEVNMANTMVVFLGDYVDSFHNDRFKIIDNLNEIIRFKKTNPNNVKLLLGNHDLAYVYNKYQTSGFDTLAEWNYKDIFNKNWDLFDLVYIHDNYIFSHAGLTNGFYKLVLSTFNTLPKYDRFKIDIENISIEESMEYVKEDSSLLWKISHRRYGTSPHGSIVWADKDDLIEDNLNGYIQIVGHTAGFCVEHHKNERGEIYFTDSYLGLGILYLEI